MNRYFALVGRSMLTEKITIKPGDDCLRDITPEANVMALKTMNETHIGNAIRMLRNGKGTGPDRVPTTIIKDLG